MKSFRHPLFQAFFMGYHKTFFAAIFQLNNGTELSVELNGMLLTRRCSNKKKVIMSMVSGKAPGTDTIPIRVIKDCLPAILSPSTSIINATFKSDIFPISWKTAEVIPILRTVDHEIPNTTNRLHCSKFCQKFVSV